MGVKTIGVIGCGNMGSAIVRGLMTVADLKNLRILINDIDLRKTAALSAQTGSEYYLLKELVGISDIVMISIKPQDAKSLFDEIKEHITFKKLIISVMAGVMLSSISDSIGNDVPIVRK